MLSRQVCPVCQTAFVANYAGRRCCSKECAEKLRGSYSERFWSRARVTDCCWEWVGAVGKSGYARVKRERSKERVLVHRLSWELTSGPIPEGLCVLHRCDNRRCVRPDHLFLGTIKDNSQDMLKKGRANKACGARHGNAKLTERQVRAIIRSCAAGLSKTALAMKYGVSEGCIYRIASGQRWSRALS